PRPVLRVPPEWDPPPRRDDRQVPPGGRFAVAAADGSFVAGSHESPPVDAREETDRAPTPRHPGTPRRAKGTRHVCPAHGVPFGISHLTAVMPGMHGAGGPMPGHRP